MTGASEFTWTVEPGLGPPALTALCDELCSHDPTATVSTQPGARGALPIDPHLLTALASGAIFGAATLTSILRTVIAATCRIRRRGIIIDATTPRLRIREAIDMPGGTVIVIDTRGESKLHDLCAGDTSLERIVQALGRKS